MAENIKTKKNRNFLDIIVGSIGVIAFICLIMLLLYRPIMELRYIRSGDYYIKHGNIEEAINQLNIALKINPKSAKA